MANQLLNSSVITNAALAVLHQELNFVGSINRAYDNSFAQEGAKIGSTLRIRLPNQYTIRNGSALSTQDAIENNVTLTVSSQKGIDTNFTTAELALNIVDFTAQVITPAMRVLAANVEADALSMLTSVYNQVNNYGIPATSRTLGQARKLLIDNLVPPGNLNLRVNTQDNLDLVDNTKGLFNANSVISGQNNNGVIRAGFGFDSVLENTFLTTFTTNTGNRTTYAVNGANQTGASLVVKTGTGLFNVGEVFTIAGVNRVHPETKTNTGVLQQFVVAAAYAGGGGTMTISPAIVTSGPTQNVTASPADSAAITFAGVASTANGVSLAYHRDAFTFATADLLMPDGVHFAARKMQEGLSLRMIRQYDINNDRLPCRFDLLYGYTAIRPQLAARIAAN